MHSLHLLHNYNYHPLKPRHGIWQCWVFTLPLAYGDCWVFTLPLARGDSLAVLGIYPPHGIWGLLGIYPPLGTWGLTGSVGYLPSPWHVGTHWQCWVFTLPLAYGDSLAVLGIYPPHGIWELLGIYPPLGTWGLTGSVGYLPSPWHMGTHWQCWVFTLPLAHGDSLAVLGIYPPLGIWGLTGSVGYLLTLP